MKQKKAILFKNDGAHLEDGCRNHRKNCEQKNDAQAYRFGYQCRKCCSVVFRVALLNPSTLDEAHYQHHAHENNWSDCRGYEPGQKVL
jgi:hypothetical protein